MNPCPRRIKQLCVELDRRSAFGGTFLALFVAALAVGAGELAYPWFPSLLGVIHAAGATSALLGSGMLVWDALASGDPRTEAARALPSDAYAGEGTPEQRWQQGLRFFRGQWARALCGIVLVASAFLIDLLVNRQLAPTLLARTVGVAAGMGASLGLLAIVRSDAELFYRWETRPESEAAASSTARARGDMSTRCDA